MRDWMKTCTLVALCVLCAVGAVAEDSKYVFFAEDTAPILRLRYTGPEVATFTSTTNSVVILIDTTGTTNTFSTTTPSDVVATIIGAKDDEGDTEMEVDLFCAIGTETADNNVLATTTFTMLRGVWYEVLFWDTSKVLHFDTAWWAPEEYELPGVLDAVYGLPGGTGAVTVSVYVTNDTGGRTLAMTKSYPTTWPTGQATNTCDIEHNIRQWGGLPTGMRTVYVKAARATTATTGGIGIRVSQ